MRVEEFRLEQARAMSEDQLLRAIIGHPPRTKGLAQQLGWLGYHTHRSDRSPAGFPDLVLVRGPRLIFAELKRQARSAKPTPAQEEWLDRLGVVERAVADANATVASVEVYLWRPEDLLDRSIESILT